MSGSFSREKENKKLTDEIEKFEGEEKEYWDNRMYLLNKNKKKLKDKLKHLLIAEKDFRISHKNQILKDDEWKRVEALRNEAQMTYDTIVKDIESLKIVEKDIEEERDKLYVDRPDLRPPKFSSCGEPENCNSLLIPTLPIFKPREELIEEGITELTQQTLAVRSKKTIELEVENIKNLFGNNDRETDYYQTELIRLKLLICSTDDKVERHDYYKEYKNALKSLLASLYKNQELLNESSEFLHEIQDFANTSGLSFETEQQEISTILNEHDF